MKLCMIGVRGHNGYVLDGLPLMPQVRVVGLSAGTGEDSVDPLATWCAEHGHTPEVFDDYRAMLDACEPDVVSVCGPFERHVEMCVAAFQRGIHVFCEKPVAITLAGLDELRAAYTEAVEQHVPRLHFAAMMGLRYDPAFYAAWRAVRAGRIGTVRLINTRKSYKLGERDAYYCSRETYGGTIPWVGSHALDWIAWFGAQPFRRVYAAHSTAHNRGHGDLEVSALCQVTLADEIFASASIDYLRPGSAPTHGDDRVRGVGTEGVIEVAQGAVSLINGEAEGVQHLTPHCDRQIFRDFVVRVTEGRPALIGPEDAFAVTRACLLARQSADEGRVIDF